jgi:DNA-binding NarL/FixJ family response regulator
MARILLTNSQPLFNEALKALSSRDALHEVVGLATVAEEALVIVHRFRPELALVDATIGLDGSPTVVARILEAYPEAKVIGTPCRSSACTRSWRRPPLPCSARWSQRPAARSS